MDCKIIFISHGEYIHKIIFHVWNEMKLNFNFVNGMLLKSDKDKRKEWNKLN